MAVAQNGPDEPSYSSLYFVSPELVGQNGYLLAVCQVSASNDLTCSAGYQFIEIEGCGTSVTGLFIGESFPSACYTQKAFQIVPVCTL